MRLQFPLFGNGTFFAAVHLNKDIGWQRMQYLTEHVRHTVENNL